MLQVLELALTEREEDQKTHAREHHVLARRGAAQTLSTSPVSGETLPQLEPGRQLGDRYRVIGLLGAGGMGAVYRAHDLVLDEDVALKLVHNAAANLRDEVLLAQRVAHRNVCRTYDLEQIDGLDLVKMEYIAGETLADLLKRKGALPIPRVLDIARGIADGLAAAHAAGIVHRDLKPGNVMLDGARIVLVDFGLAQREGASDAAGTPAYMSPEQLAGAAVDARSDLYSLGCVLFEMLAGSGPFGSGSYREQAQRRLMPPADIRSVRADVPRSLAAVTNALLSQDPAARSRGLAMLRMRPRSSKLAFAIGAMALVAGAGAAWAMRPTHPWQPTIAELPQYEENADEPSFSPDGKSLVFSSDRGHRDVWASYVQSLDGGEPRRVSPANTFCLGARWTRDGQAILMSCFAGRERHLLRQPLDGSAPRELGPGESVDDCGDALAVVLSRPTGAALVLRTPDGHDRDLASLAGVSAARCDRSGQHVVYVGGPDGEIIVVDRFGNARAVAGVRDAIFATFAGDGTSIVFSMLREGRSSLYEVPVAGGAVRELTPNERDATSPDVSADGKHVVYDRDRTSSPLFELTTNGAEQKTFRFEELSHVLPAGDALVATRRDTRGSSVVVIDPADFGERVVTPGVGLLVSHGEVVFTTTEDPQTLRAVRLDGTHERTIAHLPARALDASEGPDGLHLQLDRDGISEAFLVGNDGTGRAEGVPGLVMPTASGWRVVKVTSGLQVTLRFVAPGRPLSQSSYERAATWGTPVWVGDQLSYCDLTSCHRFDVATGSDVATTPVERPGNHAYAASSDGTRWFTTSYIGHVTRHMIANFGGRPWAP